MTQITLRARLRRVLRAVFEGDIQAEIPPAYVAVVQDVGLVDNDLQPRVRLRGRVGAGARTPAARAAAAARAQAARATRRAVRCMAFPSWPRSHLGPAARHSTGILTRRQRNGGTLTGQVRYSARVACGYRWRRCFFN